MMAQVGREAIAYALRGDFNIGLCGIASECINNCVDLVGCDRWWSMETRIQGHHKVHSFIYVHCCLLSAHDHPTTGRSHSTADIDFSGLGACTSDATRLLCRSYSRRFVVSRCAMMQDAGCLVNLIKALPTLQYCQRPQGCEGIYVLTGAVVKRSQNMRQWDEGAVQMLLSCIRYPSRILENV